MINKRPNFKVMMTLTNVNLLDHLFGCSYLLWLFSSCYSLKYKGSVGGGGGGPGGCHYWIKNWEGMSSPPPGKTFRTPLHWLKVIIFIFYKKLKFFLQGNGLVCGQSLQELSEWPTDVIRCPGPSYFLSTGTYLWKFYFSARGMYIVHPIY